MKINFVLYGGGNKYHSLQEFEVLKVNNQNKGEDLVFRFISDLRNFASISIDGSEFDEDNYTLTSGSTIVTKKMRY